MEVKYSFAQGLTNQDRRKERVERRVKEGKWGSITCHLEIKFGKEWKVSIVFSKEVVCVSSECLTCATPWTVASQAPLSIRFPEEEC